MSCREVQRAVAELCFFGDHDAVTSPHLEHLSGCAGCREAAGLDRALIRELRRALAARVEPDLPSERAWTAVLRRTQEAPALSLWRRALVQLGFSGAQVLAARLRTATAVTSMLLVAVLANGQNGMPTLATGPTDALPGPGDQFEQRAVLPAAIPISLKPRLEPPSLAPTPPPDAEERIYLSPGVRSPQATNVTRDTKEEDEPSDETPSTPRVVWQLYPPIIEPAPGIVADGDDAAAGGEWAPTVPGQPS